MKYLFILLLFLSVEGLCAPCPSLDFKPWLPLLNQSYIYTDPYFNKNQPKKGMFLVDRNEWLYLDFNARFKFDYFPYINYFEMRVNKRF